MARSISRWPERLSVDILLVVSCHIVARTLLRSPSSLFQKPYLPRQPPNDGTAVILSPCRKIRTATCICSEAVSARQAKLPSVFQSRDSPRWPNLAGRMGVAGRRLLVSVAKMADPAAQECFRWVGKMPSRLQYSSITLFLMPTFSP